MTTIETLKEYADRKNLRFDTFTHICHNKYYRNPKTDKVKYLTDKDSHKNFSKTYFGIETSCGVWFWFDRRNRTSSEVLVFSHRFSACTGKSIKGFMTGFNFERKIEKFLNK